MTPAVDIVVDNHNYARFLGEAIESALAQTRRPARVVVVDDGSTDDSRAVIRGFGNRVLPVLKDNGGQASAFNAGFAHTGGEVVMFLDADDLLEPDAVARVADAFAARPDTARLHFRMRVVDAGGRLTGEVKPSPHLPLPAGELTRAALDTPFDAPWLPTSGNAFASAALRRMLPMPEEPYRVCADWYLVNVAPLYGPVAAIDAPLARYRVHGGNSYQPSRDGLDLGHLRATIGYAEETRGQILRHAALLGLDAAPGPASMSDVANRLVSVRLGPADHPVAGDSVPRLLALGLRAARTRRDVRAPMALMYLAWLAAAAAAPPRLVPPLAEAFMFPARRRALNRLLGRLARPATP